MPGMLARGRGRIVNVSSSVGFAAVPMLSAYAVSKAALYRLSENLAAETRGHGVTVFAVNPGLPESDAGGISGVAPAVRVLGRVRGIRLILRWPLTAVV